MAKEKLEKMRVARHLLPQPGAEVVEELFVEIDALTSELKTSEHYRKKFEGVLTMANASCKRRGEKIDNMQNALTEMRRIIEQSDYEMSYIGNCDLALLKKLEMSIKMHAIISDVLKEEK